MDLFSQLRSVPISAIQFEDDSYCLTLSEEPPGEKLVASIRRFGILNPPILQSCNNDSYRIVAGRKRIAAFRNLDPGGSIPCRILRSDLAETEIFSLLLEETLTGRPPSIVAQIIFFEKLLRTSSMDAAVPLLERLGHKPQKHILKGLLKLHSLSSAALQAMHHDVLRVKNARKMLALSHADQKILVELITDLHFGGSKQQKLIDLCIELIMRKNMPLKDILVEFTAMRESGQPINIPQKGAALLAWLHEQCFPGITRAENEFQRKAARLNLLPTMQISHTAAFENEEVILSLRFPDWDSLNRVIDSFHRLMRETEDTP